MADVTILPAVVDAMLAFLLPLLRPVTGGDPNAAAEVGLHLLAGHHPRDGHELQLATEAVGFSLQSLSLLAKAASADMPAKDGAATLRTACTLSRAARIAERQLIAAQRRPASPASAPPSTPSAADPPSPASVPSVAETPAAAANIPDTDASTPDTPAAPTDLDAPEPDAIVQAEAAWQAAAQRLERTRASYRTAPRPHSKAGQQIAVQQRLADAARLHLAQLRRQRTAAEPAPV